MKILEVQQNSLEWLNARAGIPTASEWDALVTPEGKIRTGQMPKTYLAQKLAEKWLGGPLPNYCNIDMDLGKIQEEEAIPFYEIETGQTVRRVGLCLADDGTIGCSPDGLIGDDCGIEIKCPSAQTHVSYLLAGELPKDYVAQVQGSMFVTGRPRWKFMSYRRGFPPLILTVERSLPFHAALAEALDSLVRQLEEGYDQLVKLNGGPRKPKIQTQPMPQQQPIDIIP